MVFGIILGAAFSARVQSAPAVVLTHHLGAFTKESINSRYSDLFLQVRMTPLFVMCCLAFPSLWFLDTE